MPMPPGNPLPISGDDLRAGLIFLLNQPFELPSYPFALGGASRAAFEGRDPSDSYFALRDWWIRNRTPGGDFVADRFPLAGAANNGR